MNLTSITNPLPGSGAAFRRMQWALSFLMLVSVMSCGLRKLSTQIKDRDESRKNIRLVAGQKVVVLMPKVRESEALTKTIRKSGFDAEGYCKALQLALIEELNSRGVEAVVGEEKKGNTLEVEVMELKRKGKFLGIAGENEASLRASVVLVVEGTRREFESVTTEGQRSSTEVIGIQVSGSDPVKTIVNTFGLGIASRIVK